MPRRDAFENSHIERGRKTAENSDFAPAGRARSTSNAAGRGRRPLQHTVANLAISATTTPDQAEPLIEHNIENHINGRIMTSVNRREQYAPASGFFPDVHTPDGGSRLRRRHSQSRRDTQRRHDPFDDGVRVEITKEHPLNRFTALRLAAIIIAISFALIMLSLLLPVTDRVAKSVATAEHLILVREGDLLCKVSPNQHHYTEEELVFRLKDVTPAQYRGIVDTKRQEIFKQLRSRTTVQKTGSVWQAADHDAALKPWICLAEEAIADITSNFFATLWRLTLWIVVDQWKLTLVLSGVLSVASWLRQRSIHQAMKEFLRKAALKVINRHNEINTMKLSTLREDIFRDILDEYQGTDAHVHVAAQLWPVFQSKNDVFQIHADDPLVVEWDQKTVRHRVQNLPDKMVSPSVDGILPSAIKAVLGSTIQKDDEQATPRKKLSYKLERE